MIRLENENGLVMASGNEDLSVWMRTSSCLDVQEPFRNLDQDGLPKGNYTMTIQYSEFFSEKKRFKIKLTDYFPMVYRITGQSL